MKLKGFITSLITGASLFTASNISPVIAGSCENAPDAGTVFKSTGPDTWKILSTVRQLIKSTNERKVEFAYKKLDLKAKRQLAEFLEVKVKNANNLSTKEKAEFVVGANDEMSEDSLEGFEEFVDEFASSSEALLRGVIDVGRCHTLGEEIRLSVGINSENISQMTKNQNFTENTNTINSSSPEKTYRNDVNKGYSGYGNLDDF